MKKEALICPMCEGSKILPLPTMNVESGRMDKDCPLCEGKGFVVNEEKRKHR